MFSVQINVASPVRAALPQAGSVGICSVVQLPRITGSYCQPRFKNIRFFGGCRRFVSLSYGRDRRVTFTVSANLSNGSTSKAVNNVSVILLAGGVGKRMGAPIPKQFLELNGKPIAHYSFEIFDSLFPQTVMEVIIVCDPSNRHLFDSATQKARVPVKWAMPGKERQDSVYNGLQEIDWASSSLVCIHDSARPLIRTYDVLAVLQEGNEIGAAALGVPVKFTVKEADQESLMVSQTLDRTRLWEIQTPQVIRPELLQQGYIFLQEAGDLPVTDDVSIVELLGGHPVKITPGDYTNLKVTTPEDLIIAQQILEQRSAPVS